MRNYEFLIGNLLISCHFYSLENLFKKISSAWAFTQKRPQIIVLSKSEKMYKSLHFNENSSVAIEIETLEHLYPAGK